MDFTATTPELFDETKKLYRAGISLTLDKEVSKEFWVFQEVYVSFDEMNVSSIFPTKKSVFDQKQ